ncbi:protein SOGA3a [Hemiscyllium ocellatum]|uniref:protein SOGA3a n=1 Tax=Hemiscyllium ocellatum TaxID=170820 RepID=UPI0029660008|nr:protein SOGA3a [Hemiscyllium ocellatum]
MSTSGGSEEPRRRGAVQTIDCEMQPDKYELQYQLFQLRRKFEETKKRYRQEKEAWLKEKEMLLRELAEIQAAENRKILFDLKSVLEGVQLKVKEEEDQRAELQQQYSSDKYAWELERAELKCRIEQLEVKAEKQDVEKTTQETREVFGSEGKEQKQLLANIHSAAMDLRKQLETSERNWSREKMELLEQFDHERKEWESQLKDMQRKIEQIYWDVKSSQKCKLNEQKTEQRQVKLTRDDCALFNLHECNQSHDEKDQHYTNGARARGAEMEDIALHDTDRGIKKSGSDLLFIEESSLEHIEDGGSIQNFGNIQNDKNKFSSVLNAALQELAKVSEELCSYEEDVKKKVSHGRARSVSQLQESKEKQNENTLVRNETSSEESSSTPDDKALSPTLSEFEKSSERLHNEKNWNHSKKNGHGVFPGFPGGDDINDVSVSSKRAPPVPPRTSSWYLASLMFPIELGDLLKEGTSNYTTQNCIVEKSCSSPCVTRKFQPCLQESERKSFTGGRPFKTLAPQVQCDERSESNKNNNHSRWSCNATKLGFGSGSKCFGSAVKTFDSDKNVLPSQEQSLGKSFNTGLRQTKSQFPKSNLSECNFSCSTLTTGVCSTSGMFMPSAISASSKQPDNFRKTALKTESCDPVFGKSVELAQNETTAYPGSSFALHSAENVHPTKQFHLKYTGSAFRPYNSHYISTTKVVGPDKNSSGFPIWITDNDKSHLFDKVDLIPKHFSSPTVPCTRSDIDLVQTVLRNGERSVSPSLLVKKNIANLTDGRTKQQASHSESLHDNPNKISHVFQMLHLNQEKQEERKKSRPSQCVTGQRTSLPVTLPPETMRLNGMSFPRPARPQSRRLPSRWARKPLSAGAVHDRAAQKQSQHFLFDIKTSII